MGTIIYGNSNVEVEFDDRALAHLQVVITSKLRRGESFLFSWSNDTAAGSGRNSMWLHPAIPLFYRFYGSKHPALNREWLEVLMTSSQTSNGLIFTLEPTGSAGATAATPPTGSRNR